MSHTEMIGKTNETLPFVQSPGILTALSSLFGIFGDITRIRILFALYEKEMCVGDISELLGMEQSAVSHQLKTLKDARLVSSRRNGKAMVYSLADSHVSTLLKVGLEHITEGE